MDKRFVQPANPAFLEASPCRARASRGHPLPGTRGERALLPKRSSILLELEILWRFPFTSDLDVSLDAIAGHLAIMHLKLIIAVAGC